MNVVAIIPARGGSKGLPGKNIRSLAGKPLIAYAIEAARSTSFVNRVIVSTDDPKIAKVAQQWGAEVPYLRPPELSTDLASTESVLQHAVLWFDENERFRPDIVVFLTGTVIFRKKEWVHEVVRRLIENPEMDSVFVACKTPKNYWRKGEGGWIRLAPEIGYGSRQTRESLYREETPTACATRADWIRKGQRLGPRVDLVVTDDERVMIDIHTEFDFWLAEKVLAEWPMDRPIR